MTTGEQTQANSEGVAPVGIRSTDWLSESGGPKQAVSEANSNFPAVLDVTCGSRSMWFNKNDPRAIFLDCREEEIFIPKSRSRTNGQKIVIKPDVKGSFTDLPFPDNVFQLVVFDPPHHLKIGAGKGSNIHHFYGRLLPSWESDISQGFRECLRVLKPGGVLVFKWCSGEIKLRRILELAPIPPLFGHNGRGQETHWMCFLKGAAAPPPDSDND